MIDMLVYIKISNYQINTRRAKRNNDIFKIDFKSILYKTTVVIFESLDICSGKDYIV